MNQERNHEAARAAFAYGGAYPSMNFSVKSAIWKWEDNQKSIPLGRSKGHILTATDYQDRFELLAYERSPHGIHSGFNPDFQEMRWNKSAGELTIQGKTPQGRFYTFILTIKPGRK